MLTNGTYFLLLRRGEITGDAVPVSQYPLAQQNPPAPRGLDLAFGDAGKWLALGIAGGGPEQAAGTGQPKSTEMLRNEVGCAKTDGGEPDRDAFTATGLLSPLLC